MMQPPPDDEDIRLVLEARLGRRTQIDFFEPAPGSPIAVVLETSERVMETQFLTYWARGGPPRIFGLNGFSKQVAVFSERVVEI